MGYRVAAAAAAGAVELLKASIAITVPVAISTTATTANAVTIIIFISPPGFTVTGASGETDEVVENRGDTLYVVVDDLEAVTTTDVEAVVVSVAETERYNRH